MWIVREHGEDLSMLFVTWSILRQFHSSVWIHIDYNVADMQRNYSPSSQFFPNLDIKPIVLTETSLQISEEAAWCSWQTNSWYVVRSNSESSHSEN